MSHIYRHKIIQTGTKARYLGKLYLRGKKGLFVSSQRSNSACNIALAISHRPCQLSTSICHLGLCHRDLCDAHVYVRGVSFEQNWNGKWYDWA